LLLAGRSERRFASGSVILKILIFTLIYTSRIQKIF